MSSANLELPLPTEFFAKQGLIPSRFDDRRRFSRRYFRVPAGVRLLGLEPAIRRDGEMLGCYLSDFSHGGVGFFCNRQLYPGERVELELPKVGYRVVVVRRCRRITAGCFEIGCEFLGGD